MKSVVDSLENSHRLRNQSQPLRKETHEIKSSNQRAACGWHHWISCWGVALSVWCLWTSFSESWLKKKQKNIFILNKRKLKRRRKRGILVFSVVTWEAELVAEPVRGETHESWGILLILELDVWTEDVAVVTTLKTQTNRNKIKIRNQRKDWF